MNSRGIRSNPVPRHASAALLLACVIALLGTFGTTSAPADEPTTITNYVDPHEWLPQRGKSHWAQPWRTYLDTVPATTMLNAVGINFNVPPQWAESTARLLESSGFKRARIEFGWNNISYNNPNEMLPSRHEALVADLTAMKNHGIRPLIVLNANSGGPCPVRPAMITLTQPAPEGAEEIHIEPSDVRKIVPGKTGIRSAGTAANYLFTSASPDGTVHLSAPLGSLWPSKPSLPAVKGLEAGPLEVETLLDEPFHPEQLGNGEPNPAFEPTMNGWLHYVGVITREAKAILGSEEFDVEIWNELSFGSRFLNIQGYYKPQIDGGGTWNQTAILGRTVAYLRDPAHGVPKIGIGNGFANESPGWSPEGSPTGLTAQDKHPYAGLRSFPTSEETNGLRPVNGLLQEAGTQTSTGLWQPEFTPTYYAFFPEFWLSGIANQTLIRELTPQRNWYAGEWHGRNVTTPGGETLQHWITEVNLDPTSGPTKGLSAADIRHVESKEILRYLAAFANKGYDAIDFYAAEGGNFALISSAFFNALKAHPSIYPGNAAGGETMDAVRRMLNGFSGAGNNGNPRNITLDSLTDYSNRVQFEGNATAQYPPLYDRDVFAFLPFQATPGKFVIPVYVMTRNVVRVYDQAGTSPSRFDLPAETYKLELGGVDGYHTSASATDPLTGESVAVEVVGRSPDELVVKLGVTDSPRLLTIEEKGVPVTPQASPEEEGGPVEPRSPSNPVTRPSIRKPKLRLQLRDRRSLRHRRALTVVARCTVTCRVHFRGIIKVGRRAFKLRPTPSSVRQSLAMRISTTVRLALDGKGQRRIRKVLSRGSKARVIVEASARDQSGATAHSRKVLRF